MSQGFQRDIICDFWTYRLFDMYFTRSGQKQIFENQIQIEFDSVDRGGLTRPRRGSNLLGDTDSVWNRTWTVGLSGVARFRLDRGRCLT
jgi:hypothetical protein